MRNGFLASHAERFPPMATSGDAHARQQSGGIRLGVATDGTIVNNIFRNYGHQWIYDYDELVKRQRLVSDAELPICDVAHITTDHYYESCAS
jgi:hypothetical protein